MNNKDKPHYCSFPAPPCSAPRISVRLELKSRCGGHRALPSSRMIRLINIITITIIVIVIVISTITVIVIVMQVEEKRKACRLVRLGLFKRPEELPSVIFVILPIGSG